MRKIINPGTVAVGNRRANVFCEIIIEDGKLSIHGVVGPMKSGNCLGSAGQMQDTLLNDDMKLNKGWTHKMVGELFVTWQRWHLNDLRAGCEHQRTLGWDNYDEHPSEPCPVCGYEYGTKWLKEELPQEVIDFLTSLPESKKTPAWV